MGYPNRLPICSAESARTRHLGTHGGTSESTSIAFICGKRKTSYARPHIPQRAPASPALANLCTYRVDCRLESLAQSVGAEYTRYADDLAFSIDETSFERRVGRFSTQVAAILMEEVFQCITLRPALCVAACANTVRAWLLIGTNLVRTDFDRLKSTLTNCVRLGPESQNREGHSGFRFHLEGRVGCLWK